MTDDILALARDMTQRQTSYINREAQRLAQAVRDLTRERDEAKARWDHWHSEALGLLKERDEARAALETERIVSASRLSTRGIDVGVIEAYAKRNAALEATLAAIRALPASDLVIVSSAYYSDREMEETIDGDWVRRADLLRLLDGAER